MKKQLLILITVVTFVMVGQSQNLEIQKGAKVRTFKLGEKLRLTLNDSECSDCGSGFYEGELVKVTRDSVTLSVKEEAFYIDKLNNRKRTVYYFEEGSLLLSLSKSQLLKIRSQKNENVAMKGIVASFIMGAATVSTFVNSAIVTESESANKLRKIGLIESGATIVLFLGSLSLRARDHMIGSEAGRWIVL